MKSRYVFASFVTIALVLVSIVSIALLQSVSADYHSNDAKTWFGGAGDWETAGNWDPSGVPVADDDVIINGGSVTISSAQSVLSLTMSGGTLTGAGELTVSGLFIWSGGTMSGTGATTVNGGISLTTDTQKYLDGRTLNNDNNGTCDYTGTNFLFHLLGTFNNYGTFNFASDATMTTNGGVATFNNYGTFNRTTANGTAEIGIPFNNSGTVNVQSGELRLESTGTHTGLFDVAAGATLSFAGTHALNAGSNVSGAGTVNFSGGTTHTIAGSYDLTGPTNISGYGVAINSDLTTPSAINLISGNLEGSGNFTMTGLFTWSGGTLRGTGSTMANGGISITGPDAKSLWQRTLNNNGTCNYDGSGFGLYLSTFNNQTGATFNLPTDNPILSIVGGTINNYGTLNRTTSSGTATIQVVFNNSGTVNIESGTLSLGNTYAQTAGSTVLNGGSLSTSYPLDIQGGALKGSGNITGTVTIGTGGAVDIELGGTTPGVGAGNYDQLNISGAATLAGTLNVTLTGGFTPAIGDNFTVMTFGSHTGTFATTNLAAPGSGRAWDAVTYNPASVVLSVIVGTNHAPVAPTGGVSHSVEEDGVLNEAAPGVLGSVTDTDGDPLTAVLVGNVSHGTLALNADGSFTYTPAANYSGTDSFTYKANDGAADSNVATVTITVNAVNDVPVAPAGGVSYSTSKNAVLNQAAPGVLGNVTDADSNPLTAILVGNVSHGTLVLNANGSFTYTPAAGFTGSDSFTCKANDGTADSSVFTVTIGVTQGEPPTIASLSKSSGSQGKKLTVVITGTNLDGATALDFGEGITVGAPAATSSTEITVDITIGSDAALGTRDVEVTTPEGTFTLEDGFTVEKAKSGGAPVWLWPAVVVAVLAAGAGGFFLFFLLPRRKAKRA